jgi:hypothetical protein
LFYVEQQFEPGRFTLPIPVQDGHQFLLPVLKRSHDHEEAHFIGIGLFQPDIEMDPVHPEVDVAFSGEIPMRPVFVLGLPDSL